MNLLNDIQIQKEEHNQNDSQSNNYARLLNVKVHFN